MAQGRITYMNEKSNMCRKYVALLGQLGERWSAEREVAGSNPGRTNTQEIWITEEEVLPKQTVELPSLLG